MSAVLWGIVAAFLFVYGAAAYGAGYYTGYRRGIQLPSLRKRP